MTLNSYSNFLTDDGCGEADFAGNGGWFTSPRYPCSYRNTHDECSFTIKTSDDMYAALSFEDFDVQDGDVLTVSMDGRIIYPDDVFHIHIYL